METLIFVWTVVKVVLGISFVIFWHELGHFLLAKWNGVKVKNFSIGFPPRLVRLFKHRETEYVLGSIPLGGYVHMLGEDEGQTEPGPVDPGRRRGQPRPTRAAGQPPGAFFNKSVWARMAIISAGVVMNVLLGFALLRGRLPARRPDRDAGDLGGVGAGGARLRGRACGPATRSSPSTTKVGVTFEDLQPDRHPQRAGRAGLASPSAAPASPSRSSSRSPPDARRTGRSARSASAGR